MNMGCIYEILLKITGSLLQPVIKVEKHAQSNREILSFYFPKDACSNDIHKNDMVEHNSTNAILALKKKKATQSNKIVKDQLIMEPFHGISVGYWFNHQML